MLARIAATLAAHGISIAAVQQREHEEAGAPVPLVIVTHQAREADLRAAIAGDRRLRHHRRRPPGSSASSRSDRAWCAARSA